jgi:hypothetical protein
MAAPAPKISDTQLAGQTTCPSLPSRGLEVTFDASIRVKAGDLHAQQGAGGFGPAFQSRAVRAHSLTVASAALAGSKSLDDEADYQ